MNKKPAEAHTAPFCGMSITQFSDRCEVRITPAAGRYLDRIRFEIKEDC